MQSSLILPAILVLFFKYQSVLSNAIYIDCNGKGFYCKDSTQFYVCVDVGGGKTQTIDDILHICPPNTQCDNSNPFECKQVFNPNLETANQSFSPDAVNINGTVFSEILNKDINNSSMQNASPEISTIFNLINPSLFETASPSEILTDDPTSNNNTLLFIPGNASHPMILNETLNPNDTSSNDMPPIINITIVSSENDTRDEIIDNDLQQLLHAIFHISDTPSVLDVNNITLNQTNLENPNKIVTENNITTLNSSDANTSENNGSNPQIDIEKKSSFEPMRITMTTFTETVNELPILRNIIPPMTFIRNVPSNVPSIMNSESKPAISCQRSGVYPVENTCHLYYICFNNQQHTLTCPFNMVYSPTLQMCTPMKEHCMNSAGIRCDGSGFFPDPMSSYSYYECQPSSSGYAVKRYYCPWYSSYHPESNQCVTGSIQCQNNNNCERQFVMSPRSDIGELRQRLEGNINDDLFENAEQSLPILIRRHGLSDSHSGMVLAPIMEESEETSAQGYEWAPQFLNPW